MARKNKRQAYRPLTTMPGARPEFNPDYTQIKRDLNRIGILAATFFALLIVLSFFLR